MHTHVLCIMASDVYHVLCPMQYLLCMYHVLCMYVCVCMYVCIYLSIYLSMYLCIYVPMYLCTYVSMYLCKYLCVYLCVHVCMSVCMHVCRYVGICTRTCMHRCAYQCTCASVYMHRYDVVHTHTRGHEQEPRGSSVLRPYLKSQRPIVMGYFVSSIACFAVWWPIVLGHLAVREIPYRRITSKLFLGGAFLHLAYPAGRNILG